MNSGDKLRAIFLIWGAFVMASLFTFANKTTLEAEHVFIAFFFMFGALLATRFVMITPVIDETPSKAKTRKVDKMLSSLSDEELDQLRQRLSHDDGELVSLDEVMQGRKGG